MRNNIFKIQRDNNCWLETKLQRSTITFHVNTPRCWQKTREIIVITLFEIIPRRSSTFGGKNVAVSKLDCYLNLNLTNIHIFNTEILKVLNKTLSLFKLFF